MKFSNSKKISDYLKECGWTRFVESPPPCEVSDCEAVYISEDFLHVSIEKVEDEWHLSRIRIAMLFIGWCELPVLHLSIPLEKEEVLFYDTDDCPSINDATNHYWKRLTM